MKLVLRLILLLTLLTQCISISDTNPNGIQWKEWTADLFQQAQKENRLVILDLEAVWCHWCHVMAQKTYADKRVIELMKKNYIAVKVDQDLRPDISKRYEEYGWPATIFFDSHGKELVKRSGFFPPEEMISLLEKLAKNPLPEENDNKKLTQVPDSPYLSTALRAKLTAAHLSQYDKKNGGWGDVHKFLFGDSEELALRNAWRNDKTSLSQAKETLSKAIQIIDPVWGGAYQYSVSDWNEPHFEKIAEAQYKNLYLYSLGFKLFNEPKFLKAAQDIRRFLNTFLRDQNGGYYTSQDADLIRGVHSEGYFKLKDSARRKKGIPIIDKHQYSRENGWFISGLCSLYSASADMTVLEEARKAAIWAEKNRSLGKGGYSHDAKDAAGPYLSDTLEMGNAFLNLYSVTAERSWVKKAEDALNYISEHFSHRIDNKPAGFITSQTPIAAGLLPLPDRQENIQLARFGNLLFHYTGNKKYREISEQAMRYVSIPSVAEELPSAGVLLADKELSESPVHLTIIGPKKDPQALALFQAALRYPTSYKRVEWWDKSEGPMPNPDVQYPSMAKAAAFACNGGRCSLPFTNPEDLKMKIDKLYQ